MEMKAISICNLVKKKKTSKLALEPIRYFLGWDSLKCVGNWPSTCFCCPVLRDVLLVRCLGLTRLRVINVDGDYAE